MTVLGILHPGSMGAAVAAQAKSRGARVLWCPTGRSAASRKRAEEYGLEPVAALRELSEQADIVLSICPPAHAEEVAAAVAAQSFSGLYVDGNAVSPAAMRRIAETISRAGATVVDGAVVGSPPTGSKSPRLYAAGPGDALARVTALFKGSTVRVHELPGAVGQASALKLSYSSYQKASRALAAVSYALAAEHGVEEELLDIARGRASSYLAETEYFPKTAARAWRWAPEMEEVARALDEAELPSELATAAAAVLERWGALRDKPMTVEQALTTLHTPMSVEGVELESKG
ncbi:NAD(P)-dependent oxidoreductase [Streptomyces sp. WAC08241]|uniref:NAD(P)-dependent oxidoreductase n=1 Tax=Streptomyces sp. WAC08241 TaxID=2487421 RepID=UPI000F7AAF08|nr:NAD(P)-dependent oxidoreductase [Streptomyces sp. WAC08241]RSS41628.1 NAD(P)-dependent oxidoreductase [Streptomyces sp. WAC08241]